MIATHVARGGGTQRTMVGPAAISTSPWPVNRAAPRAALAGGLTVEVRMRPCGRVTERFDRAPSGVLQARLYVALSMGRLQIASQDASPRSLPRALLR